MPDFLDRRTAVRDARDALAVERRALLAARERVRALTRDADRRRRTGDQGDPELERLDRDLAAAAKDLQELEAGAAGTAGAARAAIAAFGKLSDPRSGVAELPDDAPLLLLPLRLETRFAGGDPPAELWVRVYPDDCLVDTFAPELSASELASAERYWTDVWRAAGDEPRLRAAWRDLVASHGAGRAGYLVETFRPLNTDERPTAGITPKVALTIPTRTPPAAAERAPLATYWIQVWRAEGRADAEATARAALAAAVGAARADALADGYVPANLGEAPPAGSDRLHAPVEVALLVLPPAPATTATSWTRPATAPLLPDRLLLLGYADGEQVLEALGAPLPPTVVVGPDPSAPPAEQLRDVNGDLVAPDELRWLVDFDRAVADGLGFRVPLPAAARGGLDRLLVVGVRLSADAAEGAHELEALLAAHSRSRAGIELLRQGTPTNNTEAAPAGHRRGENPDASYRDPFAGPPAFAPAVPGFGGEDGAALAHLLGLDPAAVAPLPGAFQTDLGEARAMQTALWPATLGYVVGALLAERVPPPAAERLRRFFTGVVSGRGPLPAVRVGRQPYGIVVTTAFDRLADEGEAAGITARLLLARDDWRALAATAAQVRDTGAPHQAFLDVLGLNATSVEYRYRYAESLFDLYNRVNLDGGGTAFLERLRQAPLPDGAALLERLHAPGDGRPQLLDLFLLARTHGLSGPLVDDRPLSESAPVRAYASGGRNYLQWLADAARTSLETIRGEQGFTAAAPAALLYLLLRHALLLGYYDGAVRLEVEAGVLDAAAERDARREAPAVHVAADAGSESRFARLYRADARVTGGQDVLVHEHLTRILGTSDAAGGLAEQALAVDTLAGLPTARLERLLAEHLDTCSYRLDAWLTGLAHARLLELRGTGRKAQAGVYLGAFGWLEDVRPAALRPQPFTPPADLAPIFTPAGRELLRDPQNGGFVHAPSLNHAVTAAVLRSGYLANATAGQPEPLAVNLTSRRVRAAREMLEGIRNGQSLGALLGYRLERGLHDGHQVAETDALILGLRTAFPLVAERLDETAAPPGTPIEAIEARNVVDGLALTTHVRQSGNRSYPYGKQLPPASAAQAGAVDAEVAGLLDVYDAVADLLLAEGVHQAVLGNTERAAATLDALGRGTAPVEAAVAETPRSGTGLTHRLAVHLAPQAALPAFATTPRAIGEPALDRWLEARLPPAADVACTVEWADPADGTAQSATVTQADLGLRPLDLLAILSLDTEQAMGELDDRIIRHVDATVGPRPDAVLEIRHTSRVANSLTFFEVAPLAEALRALALRSRPLRASDLVAAGEARQDLDQALVTHPERAAALVQRLGVVRDALVAFAARPAVADPAANGVALQATVDDLVRDLADLLARAASFGVAQTGWGDLLDARGKLFAAVLELTDAAAARLGERHDRFGQLLQREGALPGGTPADERLFLLQQAEHLVTVTPTAAPPPPAAFRPQVAALGTTFGHLVDDLAALHTTSDTTLSALLADLALLAARVAAVDHGGLVATDIGQRLVVLADALRERATGVAATLTARLVAAAPAVADAVAGSDAARVKALERAHRALLGDDARVVPEFSFATAAAGELAGAAQAASSGALLAHLGAERELAVDDWLHGVARVREKVRHLERTVLLSAPLGRLEPALVPFQLPHVPGEPWLGLEFPEATPIAGERLLYTAHHAAAFDPAAAQCGLLVDEWTEVLPARTETTALAVHFDRPSSEPPQAWLLVVPPQRTGQWRFPDVVAALHDTLELARIRAVEPDDLDTTDWARYLPAVVAASTRHPISISLDPGRVNDAARFLRADD